MRSANSPVCVIPGFGARDPTSVLILQVTKISFSHAAFCHPHLKWACVADCGQQAVGAVCSRGPPAAHQPGGEEPKFLRQKGRSGSAAAAWASCGREGQATAGLPAMQGHRNYTFLVQAGDVLVVPRGMVHRARSQGGYAWLWLWLGFRGLSGFGRVMASRRYLPPPDHVDSRR